MPHNESNKCDSVFSSIKRKKNGNDRENTNLGNEKQKFSLRGYETMKRLAGKREERFHLLISLICFSLLGISFSLIRLHSVVKCFTSRISFLYFHLFAR